TLIARSYFHDGFFLIQCFTIKSALPPLFASHHHSVAFFSLRVRQHLNVMLALNFVGLRIHVEAILVVLHESHGFFRNNRPDNDILRSPHYASTSSTRATASLVITNLSWFRMS